MIKFETTLAYNREKIIDTCSLEITSNGYHDALVLNPEEVKQLLDLMQEAYSIMGKTLMIFLLALLQKLSDKHHFQELINE